MNHIGSALGAYRSMKSESLGFSPHEMVHGRRAAFPLDKILTDD